MKKELIFSMESPYRDTFRIWAYRFGQGAKTLAIVGAMRGDEIQQQYICSQLVKELTQMEDKGLLANDHEIVVIPSANPFSMNIGKRFWAMDNTDINRMFPGYDLGETTQRIAAGLFEFIKDYAYGIQLASFYMPGDFIPHVRMVKTGYEDVEGAKLFGMPYISIRTPQPYDTTLLNYNWQIWDTRAFSVYGSQNHDVDSAATRQTISAILRFMKRKGWIRYGRLSQQADYNSIVLDESELLAVKAPTAGIFHKLKNAGESVFQNELLAEIIDPYEGTVKSRILSPVDGVVFFAHNKPLALPNTPLFRIHDVG